MLQGLNLNDLVYGYGFHCFVIIETNSNKYLIDCTYKQFFNQNRNLLERIGIPHLSGCDAGVFMLMDERRRKVAAKILKEGWIKLTPETFKDYMDGFLLSWRNGFYYETTNDFSFTTPYTADDYWDFLYGQKDLAEYEKIKNLGFQREPLKKPLLLIKKP